MLDAKRIAEEALAVDDDEATTAPEPSTKVEPTEDEGEVAAADEVFDAVKAGDRKAFRTSLRAYVDIIINGG